jgi:hypothetical protein
MRQRSPVDTPADAVAVPIVGRLIAAVGLRREGLGPMAMFALALLLLMLLAIGRYPIALDDLLSVLFSRLILIEPHWTPEVETLLRR